MEAVYSNMMFFFSFFSILIETWCYLLLFIFTPSNVNIGEEILAGDDLYGGADRLLSVVVPKSGVVVKLV